MMQKTEMVLIANLYGSASLPASGVIGFNIVPQASLLAMWCQQSNPPAADNSQAEATQRGKSDYVHSIAQLLLNLPICG